MHEEKARLRANLLAKRRAVTADKAQAVGWKMVHRLPKVADWKVVQSVHIYRDIPALGEVPTQPIVEWLQKNYPNIRIDFAGSNSDAPFVSEKYDVIFVPVLGFDRDGFRLGMGGGWYDRWLATQPQALKIGLAYAWAKLQSLPRESFDIPLDLVLSN